MNIKLTGITEVLMVLNPQVSQKALNRTLNEIGSKVRTKTVKDVRKTYNIKAKDLKQFMHIKRSRYNNLSYEISIRGKALNAKRFAAKKLKVKGQVSIKIKKSNGRKVIQRAFIAKSGAVLQRVEGSKKIRAVSTLSIPQMFNEKILKDVQVNISKEFSNKFRRNFEFYMGKA